MSLNDPRWGGQDNDDDRNRTTGNRGSNQGPPDLEEVWRDFNRRLSGMLGGKNRNNGNNNGGGNSGGPANLSPQQYRGIFTVLIVLVLLVWLASGTYSVNANERGVVLRLGKFLQTTEPGLRWRLPYPIESHEIVDFTGVRTVEVGYRNNENNKIPRESLMLTDDGNIINIQFAVQYILNNPENFVFNNRDPEDSVKQVAETAMREIVGRSQMDFVLNEGRAEIAATAHELMQRILDRYESGIQISRVNLQNAQPPEQVQAAFSDAIKAEQDYERQKNEGEAYANNVIPRARGSAARILEEANAYSARVVASATGDAARFSQILAEYINAPQVTRERMYLEAIQEVMSNSSKVLIDAKNNNNLMVLPLDRLLKNSPALPPADPGASATSITTPAPSAPPVTQTAPAADPREQRGRELSRNRER